MSNQRRPILGITMGDPGGIGPEVCAKALAASDTYKWSRPLVIGDASVVGDAIRRANLALEIHRCADPQAGRYECGTIDVLDVGNMPLSRVRYGEATPEQGKASFEYVAKAITLATTGSVDGTVTAPISKAAMNAAGHRYPGHTEIFADLTRTTDCAMMLVAGAFRVVHVTTHVSLREACDRVKKKRVARVIRLAAEALVDLGIHRPRIAVAGLNPHCGEEGLLGYEDRDEILPAVIEARAAGIDAEGPLPADTVFPKMKGGMYDAVVVMYHDQGHIPVKIIGFVYEKKTEAWTQVSGVNITLGLPIIRTSVDHGTAYDIAGKGEAVPNSMIEAIAFAARLASASWDESGRTQPRGEHAQ